MQETKNLKLPLLTHGHVPLRQSFIAAMVILDQKVQTALNAAGEGESAVQTVNGIEPDAEGNVVIPDATTDDAGLMGTDDKLKLNGVEAGAQKNPGVATTSANGLMPTAAVAKLAGIQAGAQKNPGNATESAAGLMSAADKEKLNGIPADADATPSNFAATVINVAADATNGVDEGDLQATISALAARITALENPA